MVWQLKKKFHFQALSTQKVPVNSLSPLCPLSLLTQCSHCLRQLKIELCEMDSSILQAGNYSSHLPLIPFPLWRLHRQSAGFLCAPCFPLNQNNYGIISLLSTFTSPCAPSLSYSHSLYFPQFHQLTVYGTVINGWWV